MALDVQNQDPLPKYPSAASSSSSSSSHRSSTSSTCDRDDDGLVTLDLFSTSKRNKSSSFSLLQSQDQPNLLLNNKVQGDHHHRPEAKVRFNPTKQNRCSQEDQYYYYLINIMSHQRSNEGNNNNNNINVPPKLDLRLNLSPPRPAGGHHLIMVGPESPTRSPSVSPPSSCLSSELMINDPPPATGVSQLPKYSSSPEATSMVLVGCPRCLMYVMLSEDDPKCPKCKSTVLLDFLGDNTTNTNTNSAVNHNQSAAAAAKRTRKS